MATPHSATSSQVHDALNATAPQHGSAQPRRRHGNAAVRTSALSFLFILAFAIFAVSALADGPVDCAAAPAPVTDAAARATTAVAGAPPPAAAATPPAPDATPPAADATPPATDATPPAADATPPAADATP